MKKFILIISIVISSMFFINLYDISASSDDSSSQIKFNPIVEYLTLSSNLYQDGKVKVTNPGNSEKEYIVQIRSIESNGETPGVPRALSYEKSLTDPWSAASWFSFPVESFSLKPSETKEFTYKINVPSNMAPGGYYAIILFIDKNASENGNIGNILAGGPIFIIKVDGEIHEKIELVDFFSSKGFYNKFPVDLNIRVQNTGNIHVVPNGEIKITNMFGKEIDTLKINQEKYSILRDSTALYKTEWSKSNTIFGGIVNSDGNLMFGKMKAKMILLYKTEDPGLDYITKEITFWIIPWNLIITVCLITIVISFYLYKRFKVK